MSQHPIPRQITTFEFKLIGQLTVRQFVYLAVGVGLAVAFFFLMPKTLFLNILAAIIPVLAGIGLAFVPVNDRPMEIWIKNLIKRLTTPTQFYFKKHNNPPSILMGVRLPPRDVLLEYVKAKQTLTNYQTKNKNKNKNKNNTAHIDEAYSKRLKSIAQTLVSSTTTSPPLPSAQKEDISGIEISAPSTIPQSLPNVISADTAPVKSTDISSKVGGYTLISQNKNIFFIRGTVESTQHIPLPNMIVYIKDSGQTVRIMKTNSQGIFSNNIPLPKKQYILDIEDPQKKYSFARINIDGTNIPITVVGQHI